MRVHSYGEHTNIKIVAKKLMLIKYCQASPLSALRIWKSTSRCSKLLTLGHKIFKAVKYSASSWCTLYMKMHYYVYMSLSMYTPHFADAVTAFRRIVDHWVLKAIISSKSNELYHCTKLSLKMSLIRKTLDYQNDLATLLCFHQQLFEKLWTVK